jgi:hypothetical protein
MLSNSSSTMLALLYHIISFNMIQNVKCHFWASHGSAYGIHNIHIEVGSFDEGFLTTIIITHDYIFAIAPFHLNRFF